MKTEFDSRVTALPSCEWVEDEEGIWETSCGNTHMLLAGTPIENQFKFCPYCGSKLEEKTDETGE